MRCVALIVLLLALAPAALASGPPVTPAVPPRAVVQLDGDIVYGRPMKPEVFYVLGRTDSAFEPRNLLRRSFTNEIVRSVRGNAF